MNSLIVILHVIRASTLKSCGIILNLEKVSVWVVVCCICLLLSLLLCILFVFSQLYNMFPRMVGWIKNRHLILKNCEMAVRDVKDLVKQLKGTLNAHVCRGLVDCFLIRKQKDKVRLLFISVFHLQHKQQ